MDVMTASDVRSNRRMPLWFAASGVIAIAVVSLVLSGVLSREVTERLLVREGLVKQEFLNSILAAEMSAGQLFAQPAPSPALLSFSTHVRSLPGIVRANIYSPDGYIRHSTDANLIGVHFGDNDELAESFKGRITSAIETGEAHKPEHLALNLLEGEQLIEAYIPVTEPGGKVAAVVEFYRKDAWVQDTVWTIERSIWIGGALSSLILVITLLLGLRAGRGAKA
jgi:hypothetical protein